MICSVYPLGGIYKWMQEWDDIALLREYIERGSEEAFAALVRRHVDRVYSVALRHMGNPHEAEEITQAVFVILARKARSLRRGVILGGWLYQTTRLTAVTVTRSQVRRARREWEAHMQDASNDNETEVWSQITPMLDNALADLREMDRHAVVLRFFYGKSMREIGAALGGSEDSARMRVNRALERLRKYFLQHGVSSTTATIAGAMSANSLQAAPMALAKTATAVALMKGAAASASTLTMVKGALKVMAWTKAKVAIVGAIVVGLTAYSILQHGAQATLREQNEALRKQMAKLQADNDRLSVNSSERTPRLPAPNVEGSDRVAATPVEDLPSTNLYERFKDRTPRLTAEQVEAYLKSNGRKASTLLAAYRTSRDTALLKEAMEKYPEDPRVAFEAVSAPELSDEEKSSWLKAFERSAPDNALANYLSAISDFKSGRADEAMRELAGVGGKKFDDYTQSRIADDGEAYLAAGYSTAEAETASSRSLLMAQLSPLKQLGQRLVDLANAYSQAGDTESAQTVLQMALKMGQTLENAQSSNPALISQLVGFAVERMALSAMDPNAAIGASGQTAQDELNRIVQTRKMINELNKQSEPLMQNLTDQDWINFTNRRLLFGEVAAMQWVVGKYGQQ
jgi:RNA polymerase sigma factor (sigma-70 family)